MVKSNFRLEANGDVKFSNGVVVGKIYREVGGEVVYQPNSEPGVFSSWSLREIAYLMDNYDEESKVNDSD